MGAAEGEGPISLGSQPPTVAAIIAVGRLLRSASSPRDVFVRLVELVADVVPIDALAIVTTRRDEAPLVWTSGAPCVDPARVTAVAALGLEHFRAGLSFDDFEGSAAATSRAWLSLPITGDDGDVLGLVALVPVSVPDETALAFVSSVARYLAHVLERGDELRPILSAREHAEWLARTTDRRLVEERRARASAEMSARALRVASDATAALLSSFDYHAALRHVVTIIAGEIACGCAVDLDEQGLERIAHAPTRSASDVALALDPLVTEVRRGRSAVAVSKHSPSASEGDAQTRAVVSRARRALDADWIVSVPMSADGTASLGVLTVFGTADRPAPVATSVIEELARRAAIAVENGRLYAAANAEIKQREHVLSMVSHDLKNSFSVIIMSVERILLGDGESRERGRPQLESIQRSARRMLKLVADLLDDAALDAGHVSMVPRPCRLHPLVFEALDELAPQAKAVGVDLVCEVETGHALVDAQRLGQVLANLIGNAIKFTTAGGTVTVRAEAIDATQIAVRVTDTGIGIPAEHLAHIFDRFWQGPTGSRGGAGLGLGLAICRGLVERSGGRIWADSTLGVGTTVTFTLPIATARSAST